MWQYKLVAISTDGLIFAIIALGLLVSFHWGRFPDLTPDGSFIMGAAGYALFANAGWSCVIAICFGILGGVVAGMITAALNEIARVPAVIAGLLVSASAYSLVWLAQGKPNVFLKESAMLVGANIPEHNEIFAIVVVATCVLLSIMLYVFARTLWGIRLRALGENPRLALDLNTRGAIYTFGALGISNGIVGLAGALFVQRSFASDINMGTGITVTGLAGMVLGMLIARPPAPVGRLVLSIVLGAVAYRAALFATLELGLPAEAFRLASSALIVVAFVVTRARGAAILRSLRWT